MVKTLLLIIIILVVSFFAVWGLMHLLKEAERLEDDDHQIRRHDIRDLREAREDFVDEQDRAARCRDEAQPKKGRK